MHVQMRAAGDELSAAYGLAPAAGNQENLMAASPKSKARLLADIDKTLSKLDRAIDPMPELDDILYGACRPYGDDHETRLAGNPTEEIRTSTWELRSDSQSEWMLWPAEASDDFEERRLSDNAIFDNETALLCNHAAFPDLYPWEWLSRKDHACLRYLGDSLYDRWASKVKTEQIEYLLLAGLDEEEIHQILDREESQHRNFSSFRAQQRVEQLRAAERRYAIPRVSEHWNHALLRERDETA
ncbi:MAG: hypothetical protein OXE79_04960 [Acidimicrobiaceae bacterium]|nr:hypothetical protein [Acidimicrobiaceae bacterium]MCY4279377.1 hypothetical protein [Acidimicrobiaceae bacterium]MCY4294741.1 hypothetical protein [Acidimicrobiaceae bacterium]